MDELNQDGSEVLETTETEAAEETTVDETLTAEEIAELRSKAAKADELEAKNKQLFERAKKAETTRAEPQAPSESLSTKDVVYLAKADLHNDDVDEVLELAKLKGISVSKAHEYLKPILDVRAEQRTSASAANVSNVRRGPSKVTDEVLVSKASKGELPDDDEGIERLISAMSKKK